jgi:hypothetical protein
MKQHSKEPNRLLERSTAAEAGAPSAADGDSSLDRQIRQRYGSSPGVIPMGATLGLAARLTRLSTDRLPLLAQIQRRWAPAGGEFASDRSALPYVRPPDLTGRLSPASETVQRAVGRPSSKAMPDSTGGAAVGHEIKARSKTGDGKLGEHILQRYGASPGVVSSAKKPGVVGRISRLSGGRSSLAAEIQRRWVPPGFSAARPRATFHSASAAWATDVQSTAQALPAVQMSKSTKTVGQGSPILGHTIVQRSYHGRSDATSPRAEVSPGSSFVTGAGPVVIRPKASLTEPGTAIQKTTDTQAELSFIPNIDRPGAGSVQGRGRGSAGKAAAASAPDIQRPARILSGTEPSKPAKIAGQRSPVQGHSIVQRSYHGPSEGTLHRAETLPFSDSDSEMLRRAIDTGASSGPAFLEMPLAHPSVESGERAGIGNSRVMQAQRVNGSHPDPLASSSASSAHSSLLQTYPDKTNMLPSSGSNNNPQVSEMTPGTPTVEPDVGSEERMDVEELVDKVMRKFLRRLQIEGERGGRQPWPWRS